MMREKPGKIVIIIMSSSPIMKLTTHSKTYSKKKILTGCQVPRVIAAFSLLLLIMIYPQMLIRSSITWLHFVDDSLKKREKQGKSNS